MRTRLRVVLFVGFVAATVFVPLGAASATSCVAPVGTFVGRLVGIDGRSVTYRVETFQPSGYDDHTSRVQTPTPGRPVVVRYGRYADEFLHVGRRYSVMVWSGDKSFRASIANSECDGGTVNADGSKIDTALVLQPHVRRLVVEVVVVSAGAGLLYAVFAARRRKRQRANVDEILRLGP